MQSSKQYEHQCKISAIAGVLFLSGMAKYRHCGLHGDRVLEGHYVVINREGDGLFG